MSLLRLSFTRVEPGTERLYPLAVESLSPEQERQKVRLSDGPDLSLVERLRADEIL